MLLFLSKGAREERDSSSSPLLPAAQLLLIVTTLLLVFVGGKGQCSGLASPPPPIPPSFVPPAVSQVTTFPSFRDAPQTMLLLNDTTDGSTTVLLLLVASPQPTLVAVNASDVTQSPFWRMTLDVLDNRPLLYYGYPILKFDAARNALYVSSNVDPLLDDSNYMNSTMFVQQLFFDSSSIASSPPSLGFLFTAPSTNGIESYQNQVYGLDILSSSGDLLLSGDFQSYFPLGPGQTLHPTGVDCASTFLLRLDFKSGDVLWATAGGNSFENGYSSGALSPDETIFVLIGLATYLNSSYGWNFNTLNKTNAFEPIFAPDLVYGASVGAVYDVETGNILTAEYLFGLSGPFGSSCLNFSSIIEASDSQSDDANEVSMMVFTDGFGSGPICHSSLSVGAVYLTFSFYNNNFNGTWSVSYGIGAPGNASRYIVPGGAKKGLYMSYLWANSERFFISTGPQLYNVTLPCSVSNVTGEQPYCQTPESVTLTTWTVNEEVISDNTVCHPSNAFAVVNDASTGELVSTWRICSYGMSGCSVISMLQTPDGDRTYVAGIFSDFTLIGDNTTESSTVTSALLQTIPSLSPQSNVTIGCAWGFGGWLGVFDVRQSE